MPNTPGDRGRPLWLRRARIAAPSKRRPSRLPTRPTTGVPRLLLASIAQPRGTPRRTFARCCAASRGRADAAAATGRTARRRRDDRGSRRNVRPCTTIPSHCGRDGSCRRRSGRSACAWSARSDGRRRRSGADASCPTKSAVNSDDAATTSGSSSTASTSSPACSAADDAVTPVPSPRNNARRGAGWSSSGSSAWRASTGRVALLPSCWRLSMRSRDTPSASSTTLTAASTPSR